MHGVTNWVTAEEVVAVREYAGLCVSMSVRERVCVC